MDTGGAEGPDAYTLCILMRAYGARRQLDTAHALWERLYASGWVDTVSLNAWLAVCVANGAERLALQAFQRVKQAAPSVPLDRVTFATLISGLCDRARGTPDP